MSDMDQNEGGLSAMRTNEWRTRWHRCLSRRDGGTGRRSGGEEGSGCRDTGLAVARGEEPVVADFDEARRKNMEAKTPQELVEAKGHPPVPGVIGVIFVMESHRAGGGVDLVKPLIANSDAMGVARQVGEHGLRAGEGTLGINNPRFAAGGIDKVMKFAGRPKRHRLPMELQLVAGKQRPHSVTILRAKNFGQCTHGK